MNAVDFFGEFEYYTEDSRPWIFYFAWSWCLARGTSFKLTGPKEFDEIDGEQRNVDHRRVDGNEVVREDGSLCGSIKIQTSNIFPEGQLLKDDNTAVVFNGCGSGRNVLTVTANKDYPSPLECYDTVTPKGLSYELVLKNRSQD